MTSAAERAWVLWVARVLWMFVVQKSPVPALQHAGLMALQYLTRLRAGAPPTLAE